MNFTLATKTWNFWCHWDHPKFHRVVARVEIKYSESSHAYSVLDVKVNTAGGYGGPLPTYEELYKLEKAIGKKAVDLVKMQ